MLLLMALIVAEWSGHGSATHKHDTVGALGVLAATTSPMRPVPRLPEGTPAGLP